jgi:hypothetical protein
VGSCVRAPRSSNVEDVTVDPEFGVNPRVVIETEDDGTEVVTLVGEDFEMSRRRPPQPKLVDPGPPRAEGYEPQSLRVD